MIHSAGPIPDCAHRPDVLIVGGGAVGIAMAVDLSRRGMSVTVLEGGPREPVADYAERNAGPMTGRHHIGLAGGRMKALGGTTRLWGGQLVPFTRADIEERAFAGQPRWPVDFAEYRRWVDRAYDLLSVPSSVRDPSAAWASATGRPADFGPALEIGMNLWLPQPDFAQLFARDLAAPGLLNVIPDAEVTRIEFAAPGRVCAAHTARGAFSGREVVLACGTIEISRLLLRTAACETSCGFTDNRHLGRWFMDHLHGIIGEVTDADDGKISDLFDFIHRGGFRFGVKLRLSDEARLKQRLCNGVATLSPRMGLRQLLGDFSELVRRLAGGHGSPVAALRHLILMLRITAPLAWRYLVQRRSALPFATGIAVGIEFEQIPSENNYIFLDPAAPQSHARAGLHWAPTGEEIDTVRTIALALQSEFEKRGLGNVSLDSRVLSADPQFLDDCHDAYHHMGGARIGASAEEGVVDQDLKVWGTDNLFVAGAAVFPSGSYANPTLTALALSMRLADHLTARSRAPLGSQ